MAKKNIVRFGDWISGGWNLFTARWQVWSLMGLTLFTPIAVLAVGGYLFFIWQVLRAGARNSDPKIFLAGMVIGVAVFMLFLTAWAAYMTAGMMRAAFKQLDGEPIEYADIWSGGPWTGKIFLTMFLVGLLTIIGAFLCYLPALIVGGLMYLAIPIVIRQGLGATDAMKKSYEITVQDWLMFTVFAFVVSLIAQIGVYACYIGIIFSIPLHFTIGAVAYRDVFEPQAAAAPVASLTGMKSCSSCGRQIPASANFCDNCGSGQA